MTKQKPRVCCEEKCWQTSMVCDFHMTLILPFLIFFYIRSTITPPMTNLLLFGFQMTRNTDYTPGIHHQQSTERRHQLALSWAVRSMSRSTDEKYIWPGLPVPVISQAVN